MKARPQTLHVLVASDNGACRAQARFEQINSQEVMVLAAIGLSRYVDRVVSITTARQMWTDLTRNGWTRPRHTPIMTVAALRREIYG